MGGAGEWIEGFLEQERLPSTYRTVMVSLVAPLGRWIVSQRSPGRTLVLGLCGPQASGKSTLATALAADLSAQGRSVAILSLDDLYLSRQARVSLAARIHPLLATRGPPGTHDVAQGLAVLERLGQPARIALPRFSKADDDPEPQVRWPLVEGPVDIVLFEGWCMGALPQPTEALEAPVNALEAERDRQGTWRRYVNDQLAGPYAALFGRLDRLVYLAPPSFEVVTRWRQEQEAKLRLRLRDAGQVGRRTMDGASVGRFVQHYERLTRAMMEDLPQRADLTLRLAEDRRLADRFPG